MTDNRKYEVYVESNDEELTATGETRYVGWWEEITVDGLVDWYLAVAAEKQSFPDFIADLIIAKQIRFKEESK